MNVYKITYHTKHKELLAGIFGEYFNDGHVTTAGNSYRIWFIQLPDDVINQFEPRLPKGVIVEKV